MASSGVEAFEHRMSFGDPPVRGKDQPMLLRYAAKLCGTGSHRMEQLAFAVRKGTTALTD